MKRITERTNCLETSLVAMATGGSVLRVRDQHHFRCSCDVMRSFRCEEVLTGSGDAENIFAPEAPHVVKGAPEVVLISDP